MKIRAPMAVLGSAVSLAACDVGSVLNVLNPATGNVALYASSFSPATVTIKPGGTITWRNYGPVAHTITPNNTAQVGAWTSVSMPAEEGATFSHTFPSAGTFNYFCRLHSGMTGTVRVE